jgi:hypothetical protein
VGRLFIIVCLWEINIKDPQRLAILNSMVHDTETLLSTVAGNSTSERECGFRPNIAAEEGNQSSNGE